MPARIVEEPDSGRAEELLRSDPLWVTARHTAVEVRRNLARLLLAEMTGSRTLDALHLGALKVVGGGTLPLVTFDLRQGQVARSLAWTVLG